MSKKRSKIDVNALTENVGKWIWDSVEECWICSNCEYSALNNYRGNSVNSNYCPTCGALTEG